MGQELPISQRLSRNSELKHPLELKYPLRAGKMSSPDSCHCHFFTCKSHIASLLGDVSAPLTLPDLSQNVLPPPTGEQGSSPCLNSSSHLCHCCFPSQIVAVTVCSGGFCLCWHTRQRPPRALRSFISALHTRCSWPSWRRDSLDGISGEISSWIAWPGQWWNPWKCSECGCGTWGRGFGGAGSV